jgi:hypothetical protein
LQLHAAIMDHPDAWPFLEAVDGREVTDYYEIIKDPVDLAMLKRRLVSPASANLIECYSDDVETQLKKRRGVCSKRKPSRQFSKPAAVQVGLLRPGTLRFSSASISTSQLLPLKIGVL